MEILLSWTSSLIVPADSQESKYIFFFLKKSLQCSSTLSQYAFLFLVAIRPTIVYPQLLVCGTLRRRAHLSSTSGPGTTSQPQVDLKVYIAHSLSLSFYLGSLDRVSVLQEHSAKEPPLTNVHGESSRVKPKQHSRWNHLRSRQKHGHLVFA